MVNGCEESKMNYNMTHESQGERRKVAIVDLDGTLFDNNSLHLFILYLSQTLRRRRRFLTLARLLGLLAMRRMGVISHVRMKHPVHLMAISSLDDCDLDCVVSRLISHLRSPLIDRLKRLRTEGWVLVIASAAPEIYVGKLCDELGFDACIATPMSDSVATYKEARGVRKRDLAIELAEKYGWEIALVATDHEDDLPLLSLPGIKRLLVNPTPALVNALDGFSLDYEAV